ncbi:MAG: Ppx/GppA family phosphatase, partial [Minicystis sp.]
ADDLLAMRADVRAALAEASAHLGPAPAGCALIGVAGTVTTLAAYLRGVAPYDAARIHGARIGAAELRVALETLAGLPIAARRQIPEIDPARADVIVAGAVIVDEVLAWAAPASQEIVVSDRGVRWGLAERLARAARQSR